MHVTRNGLKHLDPLLGIGYHKVAVYEAVCVLPEGLDNWRSQRQIGHKVAVLYMGAVLFADGVGTGVWEAIKQAEHDTRHTRCAMCMTWVLWMVVF